MKKIIISIIFLFSLTGCWNYHELNNYSIVTGIAIDKAENGYEVSVLISNTPKNETNSNDNSSKIVVYSGTGDTVFTAIKDIGLISAKELYIGHFAVLIISEDVAKEGVNPVVDLFLRESSSKKNFSIVISRDCKAKDTLKIITPLSSFPSQNIADNLLSTSQLQGIVSNITFNELLSNLKRNGIENAINSINIIGNVEAGSNKENIEDSEPKTYVKLGTLGLFKDDKLIYWTNKEESVGINTIKDKAKEMYIELNYKKSKVVIETTNVKTKIDVNIINNNPIVNISVNGESKFVEAIGDVDLKDDKVIKSIKHLMNKQVIDYVNQGISAAKNSNTDIFGFGLMIYQKYPDYYNQNKEILSNIFNNIEINVKSNIIIKTTGSSSNSLEVKSD